MHRPRFSLALGISFCLLTAITAAAQTPATPRAQPVHATFVKAFVIDERLSALRQEPDLHAPVLKRLRIGRAVYVTASRSGSPVFYRVAVTRRTRGWIHQSAVLMAGRAGEDERVIQVIEETSDGLDRLALCRLFLERFNRSRYAPRALLRMAEEAERAAASLTQHARRRLKMLDAAHQGAEAEAYYLSDPGLDRYSRLRVSFRFDAQQTRYTYDGQGYRELLRRYPQSAEAATARQHLAELEQHLAKEK